MMTRTFAVVLAGAWTLAALHLPVGHAQAWAAPARLPRVEPPQASIPAPPDSRNARAGINQYVFTTDQAIQLFESKVAKNPDDFMSHRYLGRLYERKAKESGAISHYEKAEAALKRSLQLLPDAPRTEADLAAILCARHKFAEALALARKINRQNPRDIDALATLSDALLELGQYAEAEGSLRRLHELSPIPPVIARVAAFSELKGDTEEAIKLMQRAADLAEKSGGAEAAAWYRGRLGDFAYNAGRLDVATRHYKSVPQGVDAYHDSTFGLARVKAARKQYQEAVELGRKAVEIGPDAHMLAALGDFYIKLGQPERAEPLFAQVERQTSGKPEYLRERSLFLSDHDRNLSEALVLAELDLAQRKDVFGYDALAWALYKNGRSEDAERAIIEALKLGTRDARMFFHAGMIYQRLGNAEKARDYLQRALAQNPQFSPLHADHARQALAALAIKRTRPKQ